MPPKLVSYWKPAEGNNFRLRPTKRSKATSKCREIPADVRRDVIRVAMERFLSFHNENEEAVKQYGPIDLRKTYYSITFMYLTRIDMPASLGDRIEELAIPTLRYVDFIIDEAPIDYFVNYIEGILDHLYLLTNKTSVLKLARKINKIFRANGVCWRISEE